MKLRCDVCDESEATIFCSADEAALCGRCDDRVHRANKLASRHQRFSLILPPSEDAPPCDNCRERRAFVFCQQDRAIQCRECDLSVHTANEHAKKHDRFVLTGLKLSNCLQTYEISANKLLSNGYEFDAVPDFNSKAVPKGTDLDQSKSNAADFLSSLLSAEAAVESVDATTGVVQESSREGDGLACSSSLSKYLMETLPGWQVDELLESCSASSGMSKVILVCLNFHHILLIEQLLILDFLLNGDGSLDPVDMGISNLELSGVSAQSWGFWLTQAALPGLYPTAKAVEEVEPETNVVMGTRNYHKRWNDECFFTVPQIGPTVTASCKRNRACPLH